MKRRCLIEYIFFFSGPNALFKQLVFLLSILFLFSCKFVVAEEGNIVCTRNKDCPDYSNWQIGVALGIGGQTNPVRGGDPIPLVILPDIAWYGNAFYFDNGELGGRWQASQAHSFQMFISPNREKANFTFWHPANILITTTDINGPDGSVGQRTDVSIDDVPSRRWAVDATLRWQWMLGDSRLNTSLSHDIFNVYNGMSATMSFQTQWQVGQWVLITEPQVEYISSELTDYYYGVKLLRDTDPQVSYDGRSGLRYTVRFSAMRPLNSKWSILFRLGATQLHSGMSDSPLVRKNTVFSGFAGMAYVF